MFGGRIAALAATAALVVTLSPTPATPKASANCTDGYRWPSATGHYGWASNFQSGFLGAVKNGIVGWNGVSGSTWSMGYVAPGPYGPPAPGSGWFAMATPPSGGFAGAPAVTQVTHNTNHQITGTNTYLDGTWSCNASGNLDQSRKIADITTVVLHEAGHWLTLVHPEQCGSPFTVAEEAAVMHVNWTRKWSLNSDDQAGIAAIY